MDLENATSIGSIRGHLISERFEVHNSGRDSWTPRPRLSVVDIPRVLLREKCGDLALILEVGDGYQEDW